ncbi:phospholipid scramblase 1-like [Achroia grisella]|uniref:phospholipid scramblase 1-like n=1 Tax=Achroia grisella TaxID=688607 RepID=UPI0027D27A3D|nr:phospholipid scramblase 1-like [Achroia grisella]XP_059052471.1 phospholipid scramblase 1-like [Achroia grisella]XP_059052549.1 phospholipid scramblase 1-like [Achroia grisella]XP_059052620.1 phospholipid scramblase 1-like [Achroia grisella]XP_059052699.1 phospholipid scramblase 1-like [Achroia grisella]
MAESQPLGIRQLIWLDRVVVKQKTRIGNNKYKILAPDGRVILHAKENSSALNHIFGGKDRSFHIDMLDQQNQEVISLQRPFTFGPDKMEVKMNGRLLCVIRQKSTFITPVLYINDPHDRPVLKIKGPMSRTGISDFGIFAQDKSQIGVIRKIWRGMLQEMLIDSDSYEISFPFDLDVGYKAALIGACILIDFLYYDK